MDDRLSRGGSPKLARDAMEFINEQDEATLDRFADRLEFRGRDPTFVGYREAYIEAMALPPGARVLELGSGTGVVARAIAARPGFSGQVLGIDQSPVLVEAARRLATSEGLGGRVEFSAGDLHALELPEASVDAVIAHTLLSHVTDPAAVLTSAARVLRAGGVLGVFDGDYSSWTWACSDPELARAMEEGLRAVIASKPRVMREMPSLLRDAGLALVAAQAHVYAEIGEGGFFLSFVDAYAPLVAAAGLLAPDQIDRWAAEQRAAHEQGTFFAACNYYAYVARREPDASG